MRAHIASSHQRNKKRYDKHGLFSPYSIGDLIWLHVPAVKPGRTKKFALQWRGPYTVIDKLSDTNYRIQLVGSSAKSLVVHHNRMKLCYGIPQQVPSPSPPLATPEFQDFLMLTQWEDIPPVQQPHLVVALAHIAVVDLHLVTKTLLTSAILVEI